MKKNVEKCRICLYISEMRNANMKDYAVVIGCDKEIPFNYNINDLDTLKTVKKAGFKKVFLSFKYDGWSSHQNYMFNECKRLGLDVVFIHMPYKNSRAVEKIWHEDSSGDEVTKGYIKDLNEIKKLGINKVVMHVSKTDEKPNCNEIGLKRWKKIIKHAEKIGIDIALENTMWSGVLEYIFDNLKSDNLKICYDSGHDHAFFKNTFNFERFKDKIILTHLHDNDQSDDLHWIPFDGNIDWVRVTNELAKANYDFSLITESVYRDHYTEVCTPLQFYKKLFKRMKKLDKLWKKTKAKYKE